MEGVRTWLTVLDCDELEEALEVNVSVAVPL